MDPKRTGWGTYSISVIFRMQRFPSIRLFYLSPPLAKRWLRSPHGYYRRQLQAPHSVGACRNGSGWGGAAESAVDDFAVALFYALGYIWPSPCHTYSKGDTTIDLCGNFEVQVRQTELDVCILDRSAKDILLILGKRTSDLEVIPGPGQPNSSTCYWDNSCIPERRLASGIERWFLILWRITWRCDELHLIKWHQPLACRSW